MNVIARDPKSIVIMNGQRGAAGRDGAAGGAKGDKGDPGTPGTPGANAGTVGTNAATRAALKAVASPVNRLAAFLTEQGREGVFVWEPTILIATHQGDTLEGIYIAPNPAANGAWVRQFTGHVDVRWFGAKGDNTTNDGPAFTAALAFLKSRRIQFAYGSGAGSLFIPAGRYFLGTTTLDLTFGTGLIGEAAGQSAGSGGTILRWTSPTTGIRTQAVNTVGGTGFNAAWTDYSAGRADIRDLSLDGGFNPATMQESEAHGIQLRVTATVSNVNIFNFAGNGVHVAAAAGGGEGIEGNANVAYFERVFVQGCRNGLFFDSADANACTILSCNANANRRWGFWDSSFLGNTYIGCHTAANGFDGAANSVATACTMNGHRYFVIKDQGTEASTNPPSGTIADNAYWGYLGEGGVYSGCPAWVSGTAFRDGGAYRSDGFNSPNVFLGCYSENDQGSAQIERPSVIVGGLISVAKTGDPGGQLSAGTRAIQVDNLFATGYVRAYGQSTFYEDVSFQKSIGITKSLFVTENATLTSGTNLIGPNTGTKDNLLIVQATGTYNEISLRNGGATIGNIGAISNGSGMYLQGYPQVRFFAGGTHVATANATGIDLTAGKVLSVNGVKVVGAQQVAIANHASDSTVNAILAAMRAHGLIAAA